MATRGAVRPAAAAVALIASLAAGLAAAQGATQAANPGVTPGAAGSASAPASPVDAAAGRFLQNEAAQSLYHAEVLRLGLERALQPKVKDYAARLAAEQREADGRLLALASARGIARPEEAPVDRRVARDRLVASSEANFDREFMQTAGVDDHEGELERLRAARRASRDAELVAWIDAELPRVQRRLDEARRMVREGVATPVIGGPASAAVMR